MTHEIIFKHVGKESAYKERGEALARNGGKLLQETDDSSYKK